MKVFVSFRHLEPSDALKEYAEAKVQHLLNKYFDEEVEVQVTLSIEKFRHIATIHLPHRRNHISIREVGDDMYASLDVAIDKLARQIRKLKGKRRQHHAISHSFEYALIQPLEQEREVDQSTPKKEKKQIEILNRETYVAQTMTLEEALKKLHQEQREMVIFTNVQSSMLNIVYRRSDGRLAWIEAKTATL